MSNYKTEAVASEVLDELVRRTGLAGTWNYVSGVPTVFLGATQIKTGGGLVIQILDQRGDADAGWDALPGSGFSNATNGQPVYTTGVAKVINESQVDVSAAAAFATGTLTLTDGQAITALSTITINGVILTEGTDFARGADDNASATAIANAINAHPLLKTLVTATATLGAPSTVTITAKVAGAAGNAITTAESAANAAFGGGTLTGGAGGGQSMVTPLSLFVKVWAALAKRGLKMEFWQTAAGTAPVNSGTGALNTNYFQADFFPAEFWTLSGLV